MKRLTDLLSGIKYSSASDISEAAISDIVYNSKKASGGALFVCMRGAVSDGHRYARDAYERGARIFICEHETGLPDDALCIKVENARAALADISANFFDHPERKLHLIGITGTKGKSSTCAMIFHALNSFGIRTGSIGTYGVCIGDTIEPTENSTPESYELYRIFNKMVHAGLDTAVMEVSSQAVYQERIRGLTFDTAVMTNLSPDHIGKYEHPDFEHYKNCKKELFRRCGYAVFNKDDAYYKEFSSYAKCGQATYSALGSADF